MTWSGTNPDMMLWMLTWYGTNYHMLCVGSLQVGTDDDIQKKRSGKAGTDGCVSAEIIAFIDDDMQRIEEDMVR